MPTPARPTTASRPITARRNPGRTDVSGWPEDPPEFFCRSFAFICSPGMLVRVRNLAPIGRNFHPVDLLDRGSGSARGLLDRTDRLIRIPDRTAPRQSYGSGLNCEA